MKKEITFTPTELKALKAAKKQLITDRYASPSDNSKSEKTIGDVARKYGVDSQIIYDLIPFKHKQPTK